jgi:SAM-dependent methyltransferase
MRNIAKIDTKNLSLIRQNVSHFIEECGQKYDKEGVLMLDVAPQDHEGANPYFSKATIETLDIDPGSGATYIADLCENNKSLIPSNHFDLIVCTEVLEHTLQPFKAAEELERILKPGGLAFVSTPFDFRIHGPLPDCWRFTEHGLRALFKDFNIVELNGLENEERFLMPTHYTLVAQKP